MKKIILITISIVSLSLHAQTYKPEYDSKKGKYGFVNAQGKIKDAVYDYAKVFNTKYSVVELRNVKEDKTYYGVIDNNTLLPIIPIKQEYVTSSNFHVLVRNNRVYELYDLNLSKVGGSYNRIDLPNNVEKEDKYKVYVINQNNKTGLLNYKNEELLPFKYDYVRGICNSNLYMVKENNNDLTISIIDIKENILFKKERLYDIVDCNENYFIAQMYNAENKIEYRLLDKKGYELFTFSNNASFLKSYSSDKLKFDNCNLIDLESYPNNKHSLLNIKGEELIASDNWFFSILNCNLIKIQKNKGNGEFIFGVYDLERKKLIVPIQYPKIELRENNTKIMAGTSSVYNIDVEYDLYDLSGIKLTSYKK